MILVLFHSACASSYLIIPYEIYHVHVHLNFTIYMCRYNMVVDVNEMGVKHTCRFLLGQISESSIHVAVLEAPLEYLLCQNGPSKLSW